MNKIIISFLVISVLFLSYGTSNAQELFVTAADTCTDNQSGGSSNSRLYRVDPNTAAFQEIGQIGFTSVGGVAQIGDGRLVASGRADANGNQISILIEINPNTGQGSLIGTIGSSNGPGCGRIGDLTWDPATDTLYATGFQCFGEVLPNRDVRLLTINPNTGAGTIIGETGFNLGGNALAISTNGTLFSSGGCQNVVYTINPQTGLGTQISSIIDCDPLFNSATFSPFTGEFLGTFNDFPGLELTVLDPFTGQVTSIGPLPDCTDGIAFFNPPLPRNVNVPTLSEWGLIAMVAVLGIVGFMVMRRRQITA